MKIITLLKEVFSFSVLIPIFINILFFIITILFFLGIIELVSERYKNRKVKGLVKQNKQFNNLKQLTFLKTFSTNLEKLLKERDKEGAFNFIFYLILIISLFSLLGLLYVQQFLLALLSPIIILLIVNNICVKLATDVMESIEAQLPFAIDNIIRISSKYSDIKSIIYESSKTCEQPIKGILENISREMLSSPPEEVLMDYAEKYDNVWFYSVVFTLISYLEDSSKDETIKNLKNLRDLLEKENFVKKSSVTDKRYGVVVNLVVALAGVLGFILNLFVTPNAKIFFFSTFVGLNCFVIGFALVILTIFISIKMTKIQKK